MKEKDIKSYLEIGETIAVEFKRCGNRIENDVYETVNAGKLSGLTNQITDE